MCSMPSACPFLLFDSVHKHSILSEELSGLPPDLHVIAMQTFVGFTLSNILSSCHSWRYTKRSQKWSITAAALEVVYTALNSPLAGKSSSHQLHLTEGQRTSGRQADWSVAQAVAETVSRPGGPAGYLFANLPTHAGESDHAAKESLL